MYSEKSSGSFKSVLRKSDFMHMVNNFKISDIFTIRNKMFWIAPVIVFISYIIG